MAEQRTASVTVPRGGDGEVRLWIAMLGEAMSNAKTLARGEPLEKPSSYPNRRRWQMIWDIANLREWLYATDFASFHAAAEVMSSEFGEDSFDEARYTSDLEALLRQADRYTAPCRPRAMRRAAETEQAVQAGRLRRAHQGAPRILPRPRRPSPKVLATPRQWARWEAMAQAAGIGVAA